MCVRVYVYVAFKKCFSRHCMIASRSIDLIFRGAQIPPIEAHNDAMMIMVLLIAPCICFFLYR